MNCNGDRTCFLRGYLPTKDSGRRQVASACSMIGMDRNRKKEIVHTHIEGHKQRRGFYGQTVYIIQYLALPNSMREAIMTYACVSSETEELLKDFALGSYNGA